MAAGDYAQVDICDRALAADDSTTDQDGNTVARADLSREDARAECADAINAGQGLMPRASPPTAASAPAPGVHASRPARRRWDLGRHPRPCARHCVPASRDRRSWPPRSPADRGPCSPGLP